MNPYDSFVNLSGFFPKCVTEYSVPSIAQPLSSGYYPPEINESIISGRNTLPFWWLLKGFSYTIDYRIEIFEANPPTPETPSIYENTLLISFPFTSELTTTSYSVEDGLWSKEPNKKVCLENFQWAFKSDAEGVFDPPSAYFQVAPFLIENPIDIGIDAYALDFHSSAFYDSVVRSSAFEMLVTSRGAPDLSHLVDDEGEPLYQIISGTLEIPENPLGIVGSLNTFFIWYTFDYDGFAEAEFSNLSIDWWHPPIK
jgi:hypothetical protein